MNITSEIRYVAGGGGSSASGELVWKREKREESFVPRGASCAKGAPAPMETVPVHERNILATRIPLRVELKGVRKLLWWVKASLGRR